jgi:hypothetical protein
VAHDGKIATRELPAGTYCFRAAALGYASVIGRVRVDASFAVVPLDIRLPLGL